MRESPAETRISIKEYYPLVGKIVSRYCFNGSYREDLFQSGVLGLLKAAAHFNPDCETSFAAYAFSYIKGEILEALAKMKGEKKGFYSSEAKLSLAAADNAEKPIPTVVSWEEYALYGETALFADEEAELMFRQAEKRLLVADILKELTPTERKLIYCRYFLNLNQTATGKYFQVGQSEISRREKAILTKLRKSI